MYEIFATGHEACQSFFLRVTLMTCWNRCMAKFFEVMRYSARIADILYIWLFFASSFIHCLCLLRGFLNHSVHISKPFYNVQWARCFNNKVNFAFKCLHWIIAKHWGIKCLDIQSARSPLEFLHQIANLILFPLKKNHCLSKYHLVASNWYC